MTDLLIRNVPPATVARLKDRAKRHGRSVQAEALAIIEAGAQPSGEGLLVEIARLRAAGRLSFDATAALGALLDDRSR